MRIGFDGACLSNRRGFGRFTRQTLEALGRKPGRHDFVVFVDEPSAQGVDVPPGFERVVVELDQAPSCAARACGRRGVRDILRVSRALARARLDLVYFPATYSYVPVYDVPRVVVTMHDTLPFTHPDLVFPTRLGRLAWTLKERAAVRQASRVVTVSEASKRDLIAHFRLPPDRLHVVVEGVEPAFAHQPPGPESDRALAVCGLPPACRYLLYVGGLSPHKNLLRLLDAFARLDDPDLLLVLVGDLADVFHTHVPELKSRIADLGLGSRVHFTGFVPDPSLAHLYSRAQALVQPSLLEGFGLPAVEAMACGTPVLHSRTGSLPEVVASAGLSFDPTDPADIVRTLQTFLATPALRARLSAAALVRSGRFTWDETARGLLDCFDTLDPRPGIRSPHHDPRPPLTRVRP